MISKITIDKVASYKKPAILETDKPVNLIYGLNGTGKSTFSNYLLDPSQPKFNSCNVIGQNDNEIYVYNQKYIHDIFFESEELKGIFTLSKINKDAERKVEETQKILDSKESQIKIKEGEIEKLNEIHSSNHQLAKSSIWDIKTKYSGGDRVLEFCLEGYKSDGNKLLAYLDSLKKAEVNPSKNIDDLKNEVQALSGDYANAIELLPVYKYSIDHIEDDNFLQKQIVGNENSSVSTLINKLGNSDWVKEGINFIDSNNENCPFCQENTITSSLQSEIKKYFDEAYENDVMKLKSYHSEYQLTYNVIPNLTLPSHPKLDSLKSELDAKRNEFAKIVVENLNLLAKKLKSPSIPVILKSSKDAIKSLEKILEDINLVITTHNELINNKHKAFENIKNEFWEIMRWDYDGTLSAYSIQKTDYQQKVDNLNQSIKSQQLEVKEQTNIIISEQKKTVNIDDAILKINNTLLDLGIEDFKIKKHSDVLYKITRHDEDSNVFHTLSEGEKMIISFLYFIEESSGKKRVDSINKKKIIVIDDPISSLSHIYIFNIGRLLQKEFLQGEKYEQVFILTHSLYFFYELTDIKKERRDVTQKLFRLRKNSGATEILEMKYEEIQNDYHSYWHVINDDNQSPALIANCMRNIIEYFFNFVEKQDLNNVFQKPSLQSSRFNAFNRFINRESHSLGQNIFDIKEFNYADFKDAFQLVFSETGYQKHYEKMARQN